MKTRWRKILSWDLPSGALPAPDAIDFNISYVYMAHGSESFSVSETSEGAATISLDAIFEGIEDGIDTYGVDDIKDMVMEYLTENENELSNNNNFDWERGDDYEYHDSEIYNSDFQHVDVEPPGDYKTWDDFTKAVHQRYRTRKLRSDV